MSRRPFIFAFIAERHSEAEAIALCTHFGGRTVNLPLQARDDHPIAQQVGVEVLRTLVAELGGCKVTIPMGPASNRSRAQARLEEALARGMPSGEIIATLGVTRNAICQARARARARRRPRATSPE